jgi:GTP pyrophosphokinase
LAVAKIVADIGLDETTVAAALLHDAVEDTEITVADVEREFGSEVAAIVDGVTKLERIQFDSKEAQQAATMRKMLVAMAKDLRVLIIKLADRLHNMRTIAAMPVDKQQRIASETLDIYAPLAHRLGMQGLKQQLEDLAFASLYPKRYSELDHLVSTRSPERDVYLAKAMADVRAQLAELNIDADVTGRGKHLWSIYEKMIQKGKEFDEIFDIVASAWSSIRSRTATPLSDAFTGVGSRSWVVSRTTWPCPSSTSIRASTRPSSDPEASPSRSRSARARCTSAPSGEWRPTGRTRTAPRLPTSIG